MAQFSKPPPDERAAQRLEVPVRTAILKPANELGGFLLQQAADGAAAAYEARAEERSKGRESMRIRGIFEKQAASGSPEGDLPRPVRFSVAKRIVRDYQGLTTGIGDSPDMKHLQKIVADRRLDLLFRNVPASVAGFGGLET